MKKYVAEFIGTFVLTFIACGMASFTGGLQGLGSLLGISVAFGLTIVAMAYSVGNVSGCHINPAVSLAMLVSKRMTVVDFLGYIIAQFAGAIVAGFAMFGVANTISSDLKKQFLSMYGIDLAGLGTNGYGDSSFLQVSLIGALVVEAVLTCVFVFAILGVTSKVEYQSVAGLVIGLTLTLVHLFGIPFTGTGVNPARSFGPALVKAVLGSDTTALSQVWVFIVAPLVGALVAAGLYALISSEPKVKTVEAVVAEDAEDDASNAEKSEDAEDDASNAEKSEDAE